MDRIIRQAAETATKMGHLAGAIAYLVIAALFLWLALLLVRIADGNWVMIGLGCFAGYDAYAALLKCAECYLRARPTERPEEKIRRLEANGLYVPRARRQEQLLQRRDRRDA